MQLNKYQKKASTRIPGIYSSTHLDLRVLSRSPPLLFFRPVYLSQNAFAKRISCPYPPPPSASPTYRTITSNVIPLLQMLQVTYFFNNAASPRSARDLTDGPPRGRHARSPPRPRDLAGRKHPPLQREEHGSRHGWLRPILLFVHFCAHVYGGRGRDGHPCRHSARRYADKTRSYVCVGSSIRSAA